jgi:serine/threonine protein kinase
VKGDELDPFGGKTDVMPLPGPEADDDDDPWGDDETVALGPSDVGGVFGGRFRVEGELGEGAMGRVVTALDMQTGQRVALKILHPPRKKSSRSTRPRSDVTPGAAGSEERFIREVVALSAIEHPAVVKIVAHDRASDGRWWIAMELLHGETLGARLKRVGALPLGEAWPILGTLCGALAAAHRAGFVHRDLKPDNVFLPDRGRPACKILDFGFARHRTKQQRITATGAMIGTPRFMAPEILADAKVVDARTDVYSVGVLAFEMLTGRSIYPADDFNQLVGCILTGRTIPLRSVLPDAAPELEALIARATARDPALRLESAEAFATELAQILGLRSDGPRASPSDRPGPIAPVVAPSSPAPLVLPDAPPTHSPVPAIAPPSSRRPAPLPRSRSRSHLASIGVGLLVVVAIVVLAIAWRMAH